MNIEPADDQPVAELQPADLPLSAASAEAPVTELQMPVSIPSVSLVIIAVLAGLFVLHWAKAVFIPFMLGLVFSYALSPVVNWMESRRIPRALGAGVLILGLLGAMGTTAYSLSDDAMRLVESLPAAAQKFRQAIKTRQGGTGGTLETVQKAATQIEQVTQETSVPAPTRGVTRVTVEPARFNIKDYLWSGTIGLATLLGQMTVVVF